MSNGPISVRVSNEPVAVRIVPNAPDMFTLIGVLVILCVFVPFAIPALLLFAFFFVISVVWAMLEGKAKRKTVTRLIKRNADGTFARHDDGKFEYVRCKPQPSPRRLRMEAEERAAYAERSADPAVPDGFFVDIAAIEADEAAARAKTSSHDRHCSCPEI